MNKLQLSDGGDPGVNESLVFTQSVTTWAKNTSDLGALTNRALKSEKVSRQLQDSLKPSAVEYGLIIRCRYFVRDLT